MAHDEELAARVRRILAARSGVREQIVLASLQFMIGGNLCCRVRDDLMVRLSNEEWEKGLGAPHVRSMERGGTPMKGWLFVAPDGLRTQRDLKRWVNAAADFTESLPKKKKKKKKPRKR
ncbi:MAG: RNA methyltransferase [Actinomycetota bacterium]|nr:RNA methyltransferase [Actinomycetota bacterium]